MGTRLWLHKEATQWALYFGFILRPWSSYAIKCNIFKISYPSSSNLISIYRNFCKQKFPLGLSRACRIGLSGDGSGSTTALRKFAEIKVHFFKIKTLPSYRLILLNAVCYQNYVSGNVSLIFHLPERFQEEYLVTKERSAANSVEES
jgi:hypothetical protein